MKKNLVYLTMVMLMVFTQTSFAQEAQKDADCKGHGKLAGLDLTDDQQKQVDALKTTHLKENLQIKNQIKEKEAQLNTLESADKADMTKINKTIDEISALKAELHKKNAAHKQEIRKILNDEQRVKFDAHQGRMEGQMHQKQGMGHKGEMGKHKMHDCK
ncbi:MAG: Spy/CpxP family protein refolding chaperone [Bacteroidales bacterium]|nr:Spy/CpxP family protein refolding chaperone [Bacteroidales bacterium]